jgi:hypothetical protein
MLFVTSRQSIGWIHAVLAVAIMCIPLGCCTRSASSPSQDEIEHLHGLTLPRSSHSYRTVVASSWPDRIVVSVFAMDRADDTEFLSQLDVLEEYAPVKDRGNPYVNGWNVWPTGTLTAVPGDVSIGEAPAEWREATPIGMRSCQGASASLSLHVELWHIGSDTSLVKVCTMPQD